MDRDVETALSFHHDPKATQRWKQEKEEEEEDTEEEYGGETWAQTTGWPIVLAGFVINMLSSVSINNFGIMFSPRLLELEVSPGLVAAVANVTLAASNLLCLPVAPLLHRWGCRRLLLPISLIYSAAFVLAALGFWTPGLFAAAAIVAGSCRQMMFLVVQVSVCRCFQRGRPLAMGVTVAGGSVSQIIVPPVIAFMQNHYNPRTTLLMTSILMLHICIAATLLPSDPDSGAPRRVDYLALVRRREVALLCLTVSVSTATLIVFWNTVPLVLLDTGHSSSDMVVYLSTSGLANLTARVVIGLLLCHFCRSGTVIRLASAIAAVTIPLWYWCDRLVWRVTWLSVCGGGTGVVVGLAGLVILEVAGQRWQAEALSLINLSTGVATLLVGQLVDLARVVTGSYVSKLHAMSALLMLTQVLWEAMDGQVLGTSSISSPSRPVTEEKKEFDTVQKGTFGAL